jgi:hypothetical protein
LRRFHCELSEIEYYWSFCKDDARKHCGYTMPALRKQVPLSMASVPADHVRNACAHVRKLEDAYRRGLSDEQVVPLCLTRHLVS